MPTGRYNYAFWEGLKTGDAPIPVDISIDWDGNTESVRKIINNSFNLPYIPTGLIGDYSVSSKVQITNTDCIDWPVTLDFLNIQTGQPAAVKIGDMIKPSHEFVIPAGTSKQIDVKSPDDTIGFFGASVSVPWGLGNPNLDLSVRYDTRDLQGTLKGSAGISVGRPDTFHSIFVEKGTQIERGIAIDNNTGVGVYIPQIMKPLQHVPIKMLFVSDDDKFTGLAIINGEPGQATVKYVGEYFGNPGGNSPQASQTLPEEFRGTLMVTAPCDFVLFALQTENGFQQSSLTSNGSPMQRF